MNQQANNTLRQKLPMKKRVGASVYAELSIKQREVLRDWWEPQLWDLVLVDHRRPDGRKVWVPAVIEGLDFEAFPERPLYTSFSDDGLPKSRCLPWLDMGMCIEFLRDNAPQKLLAPDIVSSWNRQAGKRVSGIAIETECGELPINYREFIDALWVAVKGVLEVDGVRGRSHREAEE